jgi:beta-lactamase class A
MRFPLRLLESPRRRRVTLAAALLLAAVTAVGIQLFYPQDRPAPFTVIDGIEVGNQTRQQLLTQLNGGYQDLLIPVAINGVVTPTEVHLSDLGISVNNSQRVAEIGYPWLLRLIPSSYLWAHTLQATVSPEYTRDRISTEAFTLNTVGAGCTVEPQNASIVASKTDLTVIEEVPGITCNAEDVNTAVSGFAPTLSDHTLVIAGETVPARVSTAEAETIRGYVVNTVGDGIPISVENESETIPAAEVFSWLDFAPQDGHLSYSLKTDTVRTYLNLRYPPGEVLTQLDVDGFITQLTAYLQDPTQTVPELIFIPDSAVIESVIENYVATHSGTFGVSFLELGNTGRSASYLGNDAVETASIYKLFVAYSIIKEIETGSWSWDAGATSEFTVSECFDRMISLSDNECAETLLAHAGFRTVQENAASLGATSTTFAYGDIRSTPNDVALVLAKLATKQLPISDANGTKWLTAMEENVHRNGIPAGLPNSYVADKPGWLGAIVNDAAIVKSPAGSTYILVIMSTNASWGSVAELARQIEAARY